ncbi:MAG: HlyC/CorC family transporter [Phycisphaerales bacterium]|nr:HlyC/CorC family transporter [Phycisphaerales bacterium]
MIALVSIVVLLLVNALLVAAEIGIVASRKVRLEQAADRGDPGAKSALRLVQNPTRYISTIQIGITMIALSLGALGEASLADRFQVWIAEQFPALKAQAHVLSMVVVVIGLTLVALWFSEILPKRLAMANPERIARWSGAPIGWLATLASPLVWVLTHATDSVLSLMGIRAVNDDAVNEDEVRGLIEKGTEAGVFAESEGEIVDRVFDLADRKVKSLMVPRSEIVWIDAKDDVERVRLVVATSPHSHFPVCNGSLDNLVGMVHVKDLVKFGLVSGLDLSSDKIKMEELARAPLFVPENTLALKLLDRFRETREHLAIVVDEFGGTEGLVTLNDLVSAIVGDVVRPEGNQPEIVQRADGSYLVDARLGVADLCRQLEIDEFDREELGEAGGDVNTVAGVVLALLGHLPKTGETVEGFGLKFEVVDMDHQRIDKVLVSRLTPAADLPPGESAG